MPSQTFTEPTRRWLPILLLIAALAIFLDLPAQLPVPALPWRVPLERDGDRWRWANGAGDVWAESTPAGRVLRSLSQRPGPAGVVFLLATTTTFTASGAGTWNNPNNVVSVDLAECWGGGQAGTTGAANLGAAGGIGGSYSKKATLAVSGNSISYNVGAGGSTSGGAGGDSWFKSTADVQGKGGNSGGSNVGDTSFTGGAGAPRQASQNGGGGGSSAGTASNGTAATTGTGATAPTGGGDGGRGDDQSSGGSASVAGVQPGGGGGGGGAPNLGGGGKANGATGQVRITWTIAASSGLFRAANLTTGAGGPCFVNPVG